MMDTTIQQTRETVAQNPTSFTTLSGGELDALDARAKDIIPVPTNMNLEATFKGVRTAAEYETLYREGISIKPDLKSALIPHLGTDAADDFMAQTIKSNSEVSGMLLNNEGYVGNALKSHMKELLNTAPAGSEFRVMGPYMMMSFENVSISDYDDLLKGLDSDLLERLRRESPDIFNPDVDRDLADKVHVLFDLRPEHSSKEKGLRIIAGLQESHSDSRVADLTDATNSGIKFHYSKRGISASLGSVANASGAVYQIESDFIDTMVHESTHSKTIGVDGSGIPESLINSYKKYESYKYGNWVTKVLSWGAIIAGFAVSPWYFAVPFIVLAARGYIGYKKSRDPKDPVGEFNHFIFAMERDARLGEAVYRRMMLKNGFTVGPRIYTQKGVLQSERSIRNARSFWAGYQGHMWGAIDSAREKKPIKTQPQRNLAPAI